ncbi:WD domain, G-beta repeat [Caulifigura coniformis]|uniref:WD domain, G-beta repeat n=1 Tax=Caulifigura coniformis TaxID=2527983 RepID=A0A517SJI8_9PLAN|nr:c-type cytochrome domain-containing protein [Caulifigura coniformis]QDT56288.1 WD domain, G-beta repeat [Caulifigura coniformis]
MRLGCAPVCLWGLLAVIAAWAAAPSCGADPAPDYSTQVAPLLTKYCAGCHKSDEPEGKFSVSTWPELQKGGEHGPAFLAGDSGSSRLIRLITGASDPKMPPEGETQPTEGEIAVLKAWIDSGAKGPSGSEPDRPRLVVPSIASRVKRQPVTAIAASPDGRRLAVAGFEAVHVLTRANLARADAPKVGEWGTVRTLTGLAGKVQSLHFSADSERLICASGVPGLAGKASLWEVVEGRLEKLREFEGHRDTVYDAELSPDGKLVATCSYDRRAILWDAESGAQLRVLEGHTGAIYDVAFSPDGKVVATASADDTCKLWAASTGERLDTLIQPLKECYAVAFSPDGERVLAGGADSRIRVWQFVSKTKPAINPQIEARFAHEGAILQMALTPDGSRLITAADNRTIKLWETTRLTEIHLYESQPSLPVALAVSGDGREFFVGRLDGSLARYDIPQAKSTATTLPTVAATPAEPMPMPSEMATTAEQEPNNEPGSATPITAPGTATGIVHSAGDDRPDVDHFRFPAKAGQAIVLEVNAARSKSPLDSQIEVLTAAGERIPRVELQAVKDSYFTFRGKNGTQADDFRIFNWEEMELNELLYCNGEVVKLWHYPRGPDSGFLMYPGEGSRWGYFDTTGLAHALGEPCYIVRPHAPGTTLIPNGLPVFTVYSENDDDARRELGSDSRLTFTAPADGDYIVRLKDVRGQEGEKYNYTLTVRPPKPNFEVTLRDRKLAISPGSGKEFRITARRDDGYEGPIEVAISGLADGLTAISPVVIEAGQIEAFGLISARAELAELPKDIEKSIQLTATARINDAVVVKEVAGFSEFKLGPAAKVLPRIAVNESGARPVAAPENGPLEFEIEPGETIMLKLIVDRKGFDGVLPFGVADAGRNLPYGVYVDNIGLNGLLLLDGQTEREFFITASKVAAEQTRPFFVRTTADGAQATPPVILHVRKKKQVAGP